VSASRCFALASDGRYLAADTNRVEVWDIRSLHCLSRFACRDVWTTALALAPDGTRLAVGYRDGVVALHDTNGRELLRCPSTGTNVRSLAFTADGSKLASGHLDGITRLWDLEQVRRWPRESCRLGREESAQLWNDLASADADRGFRAIQCLLAD